MNLVGKETESFEKAMNYLSPLPHHRTDSLVMPMKIDLCVWGGENMVAGQDKSMFALAGHLANNDASQQRVLSLILMVGPIKFA